MKLMSQLSLIFKKNMRWSEYILQFYRDLRNTFDLVTNKLRKRLNISINLHLYIKLLQMYFIFLILEPSCSENNTKLADPIIAG